MLHRFAIIQPCQKSTQAIISVFLTSYRFANIFLTKRMSQYNNTNQFQVANKPEGRILALDLGSKSVGCAVCDEMQITITPLKALQRTSWKNLLQKVSDLIRAFDAESLVIGLPLNMDGSESSASNETRRIAKNFKLSLKIPVYLQDERLSSEEAKTQLLNEGTEHTKIKDLIDSKAASIILRDFLTLDNMSRIEVEI